MKIKIEFEIDKNVLIQAQKRADYLNDRYQIGNIITAKDVLKQAINNTDYHTVLIREYENELEQKNIKAYKNTFN